MKSQLINSMMSFALGTGASLLGLAMWTGTADLDQIKQSVQFYVTESEQQTDDLIQEYNVMVDNANAEIEDYQQALEQANSNISQLITVYENKVTELENANATHEQDLADLQAELDILYANMDSQYESDMNDIIEQANAQIESANQEVSDTRVEVEAIIDGSHVSDIVATERNQLDTEGDKTVTDISSIVGEVEGE